MTATMTAMNKPTKTLKGGEAMQETMIYTAKDVAAMLAVSESKAYQIIREMNKELAEMGKLTITGKINKRFFDKKMEV